MELNIEDAWKAAFSTPDALFLYRAQKKSEQKISRPGTTSWFDKLTMRPTLSSQ
jgi:hypothetical protein